MKIKNRMNLSLIILVSALVLISCNKTDQTANDSVEGTYLGNFTTSNTLKNAQLVAGNGMDTALVTLINDGQVNVHCFGDDMDSTFILNTFHNGDSLMVCNDGDEFENEYGHMMGDESMMGSGNMMGDNSTEWGQHMNGEHQAGDEHYGGFDMKNGTFSYSFKMMEGTSTSYKKFQGTKE